jgi:hypothetical protein
VRELTTRPMGKPPKPLRVALDAFQIDWRPLFHVLRLQKPSLRLEWRPIAFPTRDRPLLQNADVGVFADAPPEAGMSQLTIGIGPMLVLTAAGHCLARSTELWIADVLEACAWDEHRACPLQWNHSRLPKQSASGVGRARPVDVVACRRRRLEALIADAPQGASRILRRRCRRRRACRVPCAY